MGSNFSPRRRYVNRPVKGEEETAMGWVRSGVGRRGGSREDSKQMRVSVSEVAGAWGWVSWGADSTETCGQEVSWWVCWGVHTCGVWQPQDWAWGDSKGLWACALNHLCLWFLFRNIEKIKLLSQSIIVRIKIGNLRKLLTIVSGT